VEVLGQGLQVKRFTGMPEQGDKKRLAFVIRNQAFMDKGGREMSTLRKILCVSMLLMFLLPCISTRAQEAKKAVPGPDHKKIEDQFASECKSIFETKCIQCHTLDRIKDKKGDEWLSQCVTRMTKKPGANISRDDQLHILYYILREMPPPSP
jgi:hypothetical protein